MLTTNTDWKSHPVIVAIMAGAAMFAFVEINVVPIHTQSLRNEIASNAELVAKAKATEEKAITLERQLKDALGRVKALEKPNLFALGNPFPVGLGLVKIGQPIDDLEKAYVGAKIDKHDQYWVLTGFHSVFDNVAYYFDTSTPERKIKHIRLSSVFEGVTTDNFIRNKLIETLGPPSAMPRSNYLAWKLEDAKLSVYLDAGPLVAYMVMSDGYMPSWWPQEKPQPPPTTGSNPPPRNPVRRARE